MLHHPTMLRTPVYIICSPRPQVGKTLLARLLCEFLVLHRSDALAFDINLKEPSLVDYQPRLTETAAIDDTFGQMALFDRLVINDGVPKLIDLGFHAYDGFFKLVQETGFIKEAFRRRVEPIVLFLADIDRASVRAFTELRTLHAGTAIIPIENEYVLRGELPAVFRSVRRMRIPALQPFLKSYIERSNFSFTDFVRSPKNQSSELYGWTRDNFMQLKELETNLETHKF